MPHLIPSLYSSDQHDRGKVDIQCARQIVQRGVPIYILRMEVAPVPVQQHLNSRLLRLLLGFGHGLWLQQAHFTGRLEPRKYRAGEIVWHP